LKSADLFPAEFQSKISVEIGIIHKAQKKSEISKEEGPKISH
jgi:hypothetical protein